MSKSYKNFYETRNRHFDKNYHRRLETVYAKKPLPKVYLNEILWEYVTDDKFISKSRDLILHAQPNPTLPVWVYKFVKSVKYRGKVVWGRREARSGKRRARRALKRAMVAKGYIPRLYGIIKHWLPIDLEEGVILHPTAYYRFPHMLDSLPMIISMKNKTWLDISKYRRRFWLEKTLPVRWEDSSVKFKINDLKYIYYKLMSEYLRNIKHYSEDLVQQSDLKAIRSSIFLKKSTKFPPFLQGFKEKNIRVRVKKTGGRGTTGFLRNRLIRGPKNVRIDNVAVSKNAAKVNSTFLRLVDFEMLSKIVNAKFVSKLN